MASINTLLPDAANVLRDGAWTTVEGVNLVDGDVVRILAGAKLPADLRFVEVSDARLDRSILTGEVKPLLATVKSTDSNYLETGNIGLAGTNCVMGSLIGIVVGTGDRTVFGKVRRTADTSPDCAKQNRPPSSPATPKMVSPRCKRTFIVSSLSLVVPWV